MSGLSGPYQPLEEHSERETPLDLLLNAIGAPANGDASGLVGQGGDILDRSEAYGLGGGTYGDGMISDASAVADAAEHFGRAVVRGGADNPRNTEQPITHGGIANDALRGLLADLSLEAALRQFSSKAPKISSQQPAAVSTAQVWHPTAAQKSYGKERRLITPPPFVRVHGPLLSRVTSVTLQTIPELAAGPPMASQTRQLISDAPALASSPGPPIDSNLGDNPGMVPSTTSNDIIPIGVGVAYTAPVPTEQPTESLTVPAPAPPVRMTARKLRKIATLEATKKLKAQASKFGFGATLPHERAREAQRDRDALQDGLPFPGLWCTAETARGVGKVTAFRLGLDINVRGQSALPSPKVIDGDTAREEGDSADFPPTTEDLAALEVPSTTSAMPPMVFSGSSQTPRTDGPYLQLASSSLAIISKPSAKTAKTRSLASCLSETGTFSLCVRIHAQTVRTRYVKTEVVSGQSCLTARTGKWDPYCFDVLHRAASPLDKAGEKNGAAGTLLYGSIGRLRDVQTGTVSPIVKLVRAERNEAYVGEESGDGDPVSDLQKASFVKVVEAEPGQDGVRRWTEVVHEASGGRIYLCAPGARVGGGELRDENATGKRKKRKYYTKAEREAGGQDAQGMSATQQSGVGEQEEPEDTLDQSGDALLAEMYPDSAPDTLADTLGHPHPPEALTQEAIRMTLPSMEDESPVQQVVGAFEMNAPGGSASNATPGADIALKGKVPKRPNKTKRNALAQAVVAEDEGEATTQLSWQPAARTRAEREVTVSKTAKEKRMLVVEAVSDWMTFVIAGVDQFSTSFCHVPTSSTSPDSPRFDPPQVVGQAVRTLTDPILDIPSGRMYLITNPDAFEPPAGASALAPTAHSLPLLFFGTVGPLTYSVMRSTSTQPGELAPAEPHPAYGDQHTQAHAHARGEVASIFPARMPHVLLDVVLPDVQAVRQAIEEVRRNVAERQRQAIERDTAGESGVGESSAQLGVEEGSAERSGAGTNDIIDRFDPTTDIQMSNASAVPDDQSAVIDPQLSHDPEEHLDIPMDFDAQLEAMRNDLGLEPAMNESSWLAEYTAAVEGDIDDTEAIRLALQSVASAQQQQQDLGLPQHSEGGPEPTGPIDPAFGQQSYDLPTQGEADDQAATMAQVQAQHAASIADEGVAAGSSSAGGLGSAITKEGMGYKDGGPIYLTNAHGEHHEGAGVDKGPADVALPIVIVSRNGGQGDILFSLEHGVSVEPQEAVLRMVDLALRS